MKKFFKNIINLKDKKLKWYNTNFCYVTTIIFSSILLICFFCFDKQLTLLTSKNNFWNIILTTFDHADIVHISFNVVMFILLSLMLERHFGSFCYMLMLIAIIPISNITYFAVENLLYPTDGGQWRGHGESCVNSFLMGFYIIVVFINFRRYFMSKNIFINLLPYGLCMFFFSVDSSKISTPADFFTNPSMKFMHAFYQNTAGHFAPFLIGIIVGFIIYLILLTNPLLFKTPKEKNIDNIIKQK